ncbi:CPBP family intramembrane glutamic endopeptidase [Fodinibius halophilus]|uniref:CPBP family intramembrane metalloprotease n=1 Tax=Fodinibius halophilus TaxID=1736908 RepID=A0A6M1TFR9_9BACT|nr:type II CAAX endopeptidase family protein [Fodinibius halophilus]NGP89634.1 CPBP family intramembrane metalloprotease [Fodinibius halophilus]
MSEEHYTSWAERNGFADWALAILWIIGAFVLFQVTANVVGILLIVWQQGGTFDPAQIEKLVTENIDLLFIGNSTGQILFLGLATWFFARLHVSSRGRPSFFRFNFNPDTPSKIVLTIALIFAIQPFVWFLSWLNAMVPAPEFLSEMQNTQMQMIEDFLKGDHLVWLTLFHVALVPAVCEEVLYRGYVMRALEKSWGIWPAIIVSGIFFGMYHIQPTNLLPLATLGMVFAFITWTSRSILPAMVAHLVNNGGSVLVGTYYPDSAFAEITPESMPPIEAVIPSLLISGFIVYFMYNQYTKRAT